jgi:ankyrin repeat protein
MWAVQADGRETVSVLLRNGADITLRNKEGKNALDYCKDDEIMRMLKQPTTGASLGGN